MAIELASRRVGDWRVGLVEAGGGGASVVFLHGSADTAFAWKGVLEEMAADHRVCAIDFPSADRLDGASAPSRLEEDRHLLRSVLGKLGGPVHLVGHSYGALLAIRYALEEPGAPLRSLVLAEPIAFGLLRDGTGRHDPRSAVGTTLERFLDAWERGEAEAGIEIIVDYWNGPGSWRAMASAHRERILAGGERFHAEVSSAYDDRTTIAEVAGIEVPALVVSGANTTTAALLVTDRLARAMPRAQSLRVDGAGHSPMRSHPQLFAGAVRERIGSAG